MLTIIFGTMFVTIYLIIKNLIVRNIRKVNTSLAAITDGDLNTTVDVRSSREFNDLSDDINETVDTLKRYIAEANARIDAELKTARDIQRSALPNVFPDREEVDLYALMNPAKEVGGDFYDFYFLDRNRLMFLVADVSGKGIPGSLFMMRAKTLLKTFAENRMKVNDNFRNANVQLCEGNDAGMFVTAWMGNLNLETGVLHYVNAGHNKPLIRRKNGEYEFLDDKPGFVLAGLETTKYKEQTVVLEPGDELFLYTDGVVEATDANNMLYGNERLLQCANAHIDEDAKTLCESVLADVNAFYKGAPQYDDLTELSVKFLKYAPVRFADERTKSKA
jgi:serine phosphatase RsbU (regulator of sigma subunit)